MYWENFLLDPNVETGKVFPDRPSSLPRNDLIEPKSTKLNQMLRCKPFQILDVVEADAIPPSPSTRRLLGRLEVGQVGERREPVFHFSFLSSFIIFIYNIETRTFACFSSFFLLFALARSR